MGLKTPRLGDVSGQPHAIPPASLFCPYPFLCPPLFQSGFLSPSLPRIPHPCRVPIPPTLASIPIPAPVPVPIPVHIAHPSSLPHSAPQSPFPSLHNLFLSPSPALCPSPSLLLSPHLLPSLSLSPSLSQYLFLPQVPPGAFPESSGGAEYKPVTHSTARFPAAAASRAASRCAAASSPLSPCPQGCPRPRLRRASRWEPLLGASVGNSAPGKSGWEHAGGSRCSGRDASGTLAGEVECDMGAAALARDGTRVEEPSAGGILGNSRIPCSSGYPAGKPCRGR